MIEVKDIEENLFDGVKSAQRRKRDLRDRQGQPYHRPERLGQNRAHENRS